MPGTSEPRLERIGHRGIPAERVENTLAGFTLALDLGAHAIELDTHVSSDGVVVVHHDETVQGQAISSLTWKALSAIDLGEGARIPTLDEVLVAVGKRGTVYVEIKGSGIEKAVVAAIRGHSTAVALHSFDQAAVERVSQLAPDVPRGILLDRAVSNPIQTMKRAVERTGARDVWPHWSLVSADLVSAAGELGARVIVWTVNTPDRASHLRSLGVAGICTDDVRILVNL